MAPRKWFIDILLVHSAGFFILDLHQDFCIINKPIRANIVSQIIICIRNITGARAKPLGTPLVFTSSDIFLLNTVLIFILLKKFFINSNQGPLSPLLFPNFQTNLRCDAWSKAFFKYTSAQSRHLFLYHLRHCCRKLVWSWCRNSHFWTQTALLLVACAYQDI